MAAFESKNESPQLLRFSISECSVCLDAYHPQECIPRMLTACGHTFCEQCLLQLKEKASPAGVVRCPSCRAETKLKEQEPFPKNYALLENIEQSETLRKQQEEAMKAKKCDRCASNPAEFGCGECVASLCAKCWGKVHNFGALRSHEKVDCSEVFQASCPKHPSKTADLVCLEKTCASYEGLICLLCEKTAAHKGHLTEPIEQVAEEKKEELREAIKKAQKNVDFALSVLVKVQEDHELLWSEVHQMNSKKGPLSSNRVRALQSIKTTFDTLMANLDQRRNELIAQVDALADSKMEKLREQQDELSAFLSRSYAFLHEASQTLRRSNDRLFMSTFRIYYDPLIEVSKTQLFSQPVVTPLIDLTFSRNLHLHTFGDLKDDGLASQPPNSADELTGVFVRKFGSRGAGDGQFSQPTGVIFGPDGLLYVADTQNHHIQVVQSDGTFIRKFGSKGWGDSQFQTPWGLAFGPDGLLYISDSGNHRIQVVRSDGTFIRHFDSRESPQGLTFGPDGLLYVVNRCYDDDDDCDDDAYIHCVQVFRSDGTWVRRFDWKKRPRSALQYLRDLTFGPDSFLYITDSGNRSILVFRSDRTLVREFGSNGSGGGQFQDPRGLTIGPDGLLYITDYSNACIQVFRLDGTFVRKFGSFESQFYHPAGVTFGPDGLLYVSGQGKNCIQVFQ